MCTNPETFWPESCGICTRSFIGEDPRERESLALSPQWYNEIVDFEISYQLEPKLFEGLCRGFDDGGRKRSPKKFPSNNRFQQFSIEKVHKLNFPKVL